MIGSLLSINRGFVAKGECGKNMENEGKTSLARLERAIGDFIQRGKKNEEKLQKSAS